MQKLANSLLGKAVLFLSAAIKSSSASLVAGLDPGLAVGEGLADLGLHVADGSELVVDEVPCSSLLSKLEVVAMLLMACG